MPEPQPVPRRPFSHRFLVSFSLAGEQREMVRPIAAATTGGEEQVQEEASVLTSATRPYGSTAKVQTTLDELQKAVVGWKRDNSESHRKLQVAVLYLSHAFRQAWERELSRLSKESEIDSETLKRLKAYMIGPPYHRVINVLKRMAQATRISNEDRAEFERLYWSELAFFEPKEVEAAMVQIREQIRSGDWTSQDREELNRLIRVLDTAFSPLLKDVQFSENANIE